jgi:IS605 OrfB family transposase
MTSEKLREWRGVKPVAGPRGVTITTRLRTSAADEAVLDAVAAHLGRLRRADLAAACRPQPLAAGLDANARRKALRQRLNSRKRDLTAQSSARWANAIISANDVQYRLARDAQYRQIIGLRASIATIDKRLAQPTGDLLSREGRRVRHKPHLPKGYATQAERFQKQRRAQHLRAELAKVQSDRDKKRLRVTDGGKRLAKIRQHLGAAGGSLNDWQQDWDCARYRFAAIGSAGEPFGNMTITVAPTGEVSLRLPKPLEHLANAQHGRYMLSSKVAFAYRAEEWAARIIGGKSVAYKITRKPRRAGRYLTAAWATQPLADNLMPHGPESIAPGPVVGVDLNAGHLALRRLDANGNPVGQPTSVDFDLSGTSARRDAQIRHSITKLVRYTRRHRIDTIAVEDLDFTDARQLGRETMGRGHHGKRFRRTVSAMPTAVFCRRLAAQTSRHGIRLLAVNPAYTSAWGDQHWRSPYQHVTRHQAAATVIGRRAQGFKARRRKGVTGSRPEDRDRRATDQAASTASGRTVADTGQGCTEPNLARPAGYERDYRAGQPLHRQWPTNGHQFISNGYRRV